MRVIPMRPPRFSDFNLPETLKEIVDLKNGIVLVTGPTGSGKSSTLAAVIDLINETHYTTSLRSKIRLNSCIRTKLDDSPARTALRHAEALPSHCARLCARRRK